MITVLLPPTRQATISDLRFWLLRHMPGIPFQLGQRNPVTACVLEVEDGTICHLFSGRLTVI